MRIELKRGGLAAAVDTKGGELVSFRDEQGTEYIWSGDPSCWPGRNPNLFPIVGSLKEGRVRIGGRSYEMGRHGFARQMEFSLAEQGEDFAVLELCQSEETLEQYPFPFVLRVRHQLTENGFETRFEIRNPGEEELLFCVGGHTAFNCPMRAGERFEDYRLVFDQVEDACPAVPTAQGLLGGGTGPALDHSDTICLDHAVFDQLDTLIFEGLRSKGVTLRHKDGGRGVHMDFSEFPMVAFWTMANGNAPYICLEPWHGCAAREDESGDFADKPHVIRLAPGAEKRLSYRVELR